MFLNAVERQIFADGNSVKVFADVLRDQGSYLTVLLEATWKKHIVSAITLMYVCSYAIVIRMLLTF